MSSLCIWLSSMLSHLSSLCCTLINRIPCPFPGEPQITDQNFTPSPNVTTFCLSRAYSSLSVLKILLSLSYRYLGHSLSHHYLYSAPQTSVCMSLSQGKSIQETHLVWNCRRAGSGQNIKPIAHPRDTIADGKADFSPPDLMLPTHLSPSPI